MRFLDLLGFILLLLSDDTQWRREGEGEGGREGEGDWFGDVRV
jgi:hypothetical protein